jgi:hypothetical protein
LTNASAGLPSSAWWQQQQQSLQICESHQFDMAAEHLSLHALAAQQKHANTQQHGWPLL